MTPAVRRLALATLLACAPTLTFAQGSGEGEPKPAPLHEATIDDLFDRLKAASERDASRIESELSDRWSTSGSDSEDLLLLRGRKALREKDFKRAIGHFSRLIAFNPEFAEAWNGRATAYFADEQLGRSLADLYEVLRLEPRHFGAIIGMGLILEMLDRDEEASKAYEAALAIHPHVEGAEEGLERLRKSVKGEDV